MTGLPRAARVILNEGTLCYLAAPSGAGPHVTPVVFVLDGGRVWGTTGRGTTKVKLWRRAPVAGGLVGHRGRWLAFRGHVTLYDALDPSTWPLSLRRGPRVASASARFSLKNARFFAGYARDVTRVPLAWTPPGRVIFSIDVSAGVVLEEGRLLEQWGSWPQRVQGLTAYREASPGLSGERLPEGIRDLVREPGEATIGIDGRLGPLVLPAGWSGSGGTYFARLPTPVMALAGVERESLVSLVIDRASAWRAARMRGLLLRGPSSIYVGDQLRSGRDLLQDEAGDIEGMTAVRIRPRSAVWWSGWSSGTVRSP